MRTHGQDGAQQIARIVGRSGQAAIMQAQHTFIDHMRIDRRKGKAAKTHADRQDHGRFDGRTQAGPVCGPMPGKRAHSATSLISCSKCWKAGTSNPVRQTSKVSACPAGKLFSDAGALDSLSTLSGNTVTQAPAATQAIMM